MTGTPMINGVTLLFSMILVNCLATPSPLTPMRSGSIGVPHYGVQNGAKRLPKRGKGFERYRMHSPHYWAQPRLVDAIMNVAARVENQIPNGYPLLIGDLSARYGGKIPGHRSHRTGRDVDLLWYLTTPSGAPVRSPGFIRIGTDGLGRVSYDQRKAQYLRLDVERQWLLVKELLLSKEANVQWIFLSRGIEALLIDYARARGEDLTLIWHAETVMLQPGDSLPHDDHIHLRTACTPEEAIRGCEGGGPYWDWLPPMPSLKDSFPGFENEFLASLENLAGTTRPPVQTMLLHQPTRFFN